jgi:hypothetical protein
MAMIGVVCLGFWGWFLGWGEKEKNTMYSLRGDNSSNRECHSEPQAKNLLALKNGTKDWCQVN